MARVCEGPSGVILRVYSDILLDFFHLQKKTEKLGEQISLKLFCFYLPYMILG